MDLVVDRDHDGNGRMLHIVKVQLSVFQVTGADLEISTDPVSSVLREIQLSVFSRMEDGILEISCNLSLSRALRHDFIHSVMAFPENFPHDRLMFRQILQVSRHSRILASETCDDVLKIRHMIVGEALDLLLFHDRDIFLGDLLL